MMTLSKLKSLKSLNLMGAKLTDGGLKAIAGLENLEQLNLHGCKKIEGPGLQLLVQLKHLKELDSWHVLGEPGTRDDGFGYLAMMTLLEELSLNHCSEFSPNSLYRLKGLKNLKTINLSYAFHLQGLYIWGPAGIGSI
jgi:Leucine-rich repeat (LRR) protein